MADDPLADDGTNPAQPPPVPPVGTVLYDELMSGIEPDLVTGQLPLLVEKYKDESSERRQERVERYKKAFMEYEKQFRAYAQSWEEGMKRFTHEVQQAQEQAVKSSDEKAFGNFDDLLSAA